jgi:LysM repeat protein
LVIRADDTADAQICPWLGFLDDPESSALYPRSDHRCYVPGAPRPDASWQTRFCLTARHQQCPHFRSTVDRPEPRALVVAPRRRWASRSAGVVGVAALTLVVAGASVRAFDRFPGSAQPAITPTASVPSVAATAPPSATFVATPVPTEVTQAPAPTEPALVPGPTPTAAPVAPTAPTQNATVPPNATPTSETSYVVVPGDTLAIIANRFGVSVNALMQLNDIDDPNLISIGTTLRLPAGARPSPTP